LDAGGWEQISVSNPNSLQIVLCNNITETVCKIQAATDAKQCVSIDYFVNNYIDGKVLGMIVERTTEVGNIKFTAVIEKGNHKVNELKIAQHLGIKTLVTISDNSTAFWAQDLAYRVSDLFYNKKKNTCSCKQDQLHITTNNWNKKSKTSYTRNNGNTYYLKDFTQLQKQVA
jgi:hypothetical protein